MVKRRVIRRYGDILSVVEEKLGTDVLQYFDTNVEIPDELDLGGIDKSEAKVLFLHWILVYKSGAKVELESGIPHTTYNKVMRRLLYHISDWSRNEIMNIPSLEERSRIALEWVLEDQFLDITMVVDGTHFRIFKPEGLKERKTYRSFKMKSKPAVAYCIIALMSGQIVYCSPGFPANMHDITVIKECSEDLTSILDTGDRILADKGYIGIGKDPVLGWYDFVTPKKKPRNRGLTPEQNRWNGSIKRERVRIEYVFKDLKNTFRILRKPYRGKLRHHEHIVSICCAIHNLRLSFPLGQAN